MTQRRAIWIPALTMAVVLFACAGSHAQEMKPDNSSNGTLIGVGSGAAGGALLGLLTEEICSPQDCAILGAVVGGVIGLVVDRKTGQPGPVGPGSLVDDGLLNGGVFGALAGTAISLIDARFFRCKPGPDRGPCTRNGVLVDALRAAEWAATIGVVIDAAIPSRLPGQGSAPARAQRRLVVRVALRF
jgi:hypothetical protein